MSTRLDFHEFVSAVSDAQADLATALNWALTASYNLESEHDTHARDRILAHLAAAEQAIIRATEAVESNPEPHDSEEGQQ